MWVTHWLSRRLRRYRKTRRERSKRCAKGWKTVPDVDDNLFLFNMLWNFMDSVAGCDEGSCSDDIGGDPA